MVGAEGLEEGVGGLGGALEECDDGAAAADASDAGAVDALFGAGFHEGIDEGVGLAAGKLEAEAVGVMAGEQESAGAVERALALGRVEGAHAGLVVGEFLHGL